MSFKAEMFDTEIHDGFIGSWEINFYDGYQMPNGCTGLTGTKNECLRAAEKAGLNRDEIEMKAYDGRYHE